MRKGATMEGEMNNFIVVWILVLACLNYTYIIGKFIPKGKIRLLVLSIVICSFLWLPLNLTTMHLGGLTSFFIAWLANFKILLFAYGKGPLSSDPPIPLAGFVAMACLPIKTSYTSSSSESKNPIQESTKMVKKVVLVKFILFGILLKVYDYNEYIHKNLRMSLYCIHIYFMLEIILAMVAYVAQTLVHMELEPQFDEPYLATSLQDFWGKRWNLMVTSILHPTIYDPIHSTFVGWMSRKWASLVAIFVTFVVSLSGLMHEFIFYNIGRLKSNGEVTCFFLLHGFLVIIEVAIKRVAKGKLDLPPIVSRPLTLGCVLVTCFWLFFPPFLRFKPDIRGCQETIAFLEFVTTGRLISPSNASCPYLLT